MWNEYGQYTLDFSGTPGDSKPSLISIDQLWAIELDKIQFSCSD